MKTGQTSASERIREAGAAIESDIIALRRELHRHPELSGQEVCTGETVCAQLDALGVPYRRAGGTGVIATIRGEAPSAYDAAGSPAVRVALRADMDALPVTERTGVDYASQNQGVMHACGHDCHMAMMLGAVRILNDLRDCLCGEVRVIFQPAEEISIGALKMIEDGALDGVDAIFGAHVWSEVDAGKFSCEPGQRTAHTDWFRVDIEGVSAHGSMPHKGVDAIVVGEEAVGSYRGTLSGEDFSEYLRFVPGVFVFVGCRNSEVGAEHPQHSCFYQVDESVLAKGAMVAAQWAVDALAGDACDACGTSSPVGSVRA